MNKRYKFEKVINDRWSIWYMEIPRSRNKLGVWRVIDLYSGVRTTRFVFRWKVRGDKTQEIFDNQLLSGAIRNFYRDPNQFKGNHPIPSKKSFNN